MFMVCVRWVGVGEMGGVSGVGEMGGVSGPPDRKSAG